MKDIAIREAPEGDFRSIVDLNGIEVVQTSAMDLERNPMTGIAGEIR